MYRSCPLFPPSQVAAMVQRFEDRHLGSAQLRFDAETVAAEDPSQLQDLSNIGRAVAEVRGW